MREDHILEDRNITLGLVKKLHRHPVVPCRIRR